MQIGDARWMMPLRISGPFLNSALYANPLVLEFLKPILGADLIVANITCVTSFPGAKAQHWHRDHPPIFQEKLSIGPKLNPYAVAIPLIALDERTGATAIKPGSHLALDHPKSRVSPQVTYAAMGDCYAMDYRVWHGGTANHSKSPPPHRLHSLCAVLVCRPFQFYAPTSD